MCLQGGEDPAATLGPVARNLFLKARKDLAEDGPVTLLLESPGGYAKDAFAIARILCHHAGGFTVVVPSYAKSAATLLSLGAEEIIMGADAEMGPLDAQQWDTEREERTSALDEIQALERLHSAALEQLDQTMMVMMSGAQKRTEIMLPIACRFVSDLMKPLLEKIDTVHYAKQSRVLKVAEDYATRLLLPHHGEAAAAEIANRLVNGYPEHGFVIDREEMEGLMEVSLKPPENVEDPIQRIDEFLISQPPFVAIGRLEEIK
jgi:Serine dehydrogenase proteinase